MKMNKSDDKELIRLKKALEREKDKNIILREENEMLHRMLDDVHNSTSWKVSWPVRAAGEFVKHTGMPEFFHKTRTFCGLVKTSGFSGALRTAKELRSMKNENAEVDLAPDSEYQENRDYSGFSTDVKALAFYLPQYHTFPENDEWWGKGFTEWTNVRKGEPRFPGHYQPRVPHPDFGYYDLSDVSTLKKQARLMKQHGIYGLCIYYYWFSGKRLLEKPLDLLLEHKEIDLPFCLCWANENWTRTWDGQNNNVLIAQKYSEEDNQNFIPDMKKYLDDPRYIRIDGKPLIVVYNPKEIPGCGKAFLKWRESARDLGIGDILIWTMQTKNNTAETIGIQQYIDAEVDFPPHNMWWNDAVIRDVDTRGQTSHLFDYPKIAQHAIRKMQTEDNVLPLHHTVMLAWDNAARKKSDWFSYCRFSLKSFHRWLAEVRDNTRAEFREEERFMFINAWNEWGEGTYLEPDERYGYAAINTVSKVLFDLPLKDDLKVISEKDLPAGSILLAEKNGGEKESARIAVQIHMFYPDVLEETLDSVNGIPYPFDCYVSTDTEEKRQEIERVMRQKCLAANTVVEVYPNKGRDVLPFLLQMKERIGRYEYICHIHSKKTATNEHGNDWRRYIFRHLLGSSEEIRRIFRLFEEDPRLGIVMPETYPVLALQAEWGGNKEGVQSVLRLMDAETPLPADPVFPVGNMFWARTDAVKKMFSRMADEAEFPEESGQVNGTTAHEIERAWIYLARAEGYSYRKVFNNCTANAALPEKKRSMIYAHYNVDGAISDDDLRSFRAIRALAAQAWFVSNSSLDDRSREKLEMSGCRIVIRDNKGYDFGAWKEVLLSCKDEICSAEELVLANNSCLPPVFDLRHAFSAMESEDVDFWGMALFPYCADGSYIQRDHIDEHIQSYFMVFRKRALESGAFWKFWEELPEAETLKEAIACGEASLTTVLKDAGLAYAPYIKETYYIHRFLNSYAIPYEKPSSLVLLGDPLIKKKCYQQMSAEERERLEYLRKELG